MFKKVLCLIIIFGLIGNSFASTTVELSHGNYNEEGIEGFINNIQYNFYDKVTGKCLYHKHLDHDGSEEYISFNTWHPVVFVLIDYYPIIPDQVADGLEVAYHTNIILKDNSRYCIYENGWMHHASIVNMGPL